MQPTIAWVWSSRPARALVYCAPGLGAAGFVYVFATRGLLHPLSLVLLAGLSVATVTVALARAPILLFWLVPLSMVFFVPAWIEPFDLLIAMLAVAGLLSSRVRWRELHLEPLEWRFLLFLASLGTTFLGPFEPRKFLGAVKLFSVGLLAFEVARFGARRFGRSALAWGPALFAGITAAMLFQRAASMGLSALVDEYLRGSTSKLPWGTSNYVSAVLVICLPAALHLSRLPSSERSHRGVAFALLVTSVGGILVTTSRGGMLLMAAFLLGAGLRLRRGGWGALLSAAGLLGVLGLTPLGQFLAGRFTSTPGLSSAMARVVGWGLAWQRGFAHLPFGVGAGQGVVQQDRLGIADPHNFYLTLFSEGGPLSLALWLWMFAALWRKAGALARAPETAAAGTALQGTVALAVFNSCIEPTFPGYLYQTLFWWLAGTFYGADPAAERSRGGPES